MAQLFLRNIDDHNFLCIFSVTLFISPNFARFRHSKSPTNPRLAFFHPYGEVAQIQVIGINDEIPANVQKWCDVKQLVPKTHSAIVEFLTARTAKFVVGVLRKRLGQLTFKYFISQILHQPFPFLRQILTSP